MTQREWFEFKGYLLVGGAAYAALGFLNGGDLIGFAIAGGIATIWLVLVTVETLSP